MDGDASSSSLFGEGGVDCPGPGRLGFVYLVVSLGFGGLCFLTIVSWYRFCASSRGRSGTAALVLTPSLRVPYLSQIFQSLCLQKTSYSYLSPRGTSFLNPQESYFLSLFTAYHPSHKPSTKEEPANLTPIPLRPILEIPRRRRRPHLLRRNHHRRKCRECEHASGDLC